MIGQLCLEKLIMLYNKIVVGAMVVSNANHVVFLKERL